MKLRQGDKENNFKKSRNGEKLKIPFTMTKNYEKVRNAIFHKAFYNQVPVGCNQKKCYRRFSRGAKGEFTRKALTLVLLCIFFANCLYPPSQHGSSDLSLTFFAFFANFKRYHYMDEIGSSDLSLSFLAFFFANCTYCHREHDEEQLHYYDRADI